jgi:hypothetical protein
MIETIAAGLIVATVSGLTFVAYKHPRGYQKLYLPLIGVLAGYWLLHMAYSFGVMNGFYDALGGVRALNKELVQTPSLIPDPWWMDALPMIAVGYLAFLRSLPSILDVDSRK